MENPFRSENVHSLFCGCSLQYLQRLIFETLGWDDFKIIFKYDLKVKGFVHQNWGIMPLS